MVDIYRINRQFERGFLSHTDLSEPPDDRQNSNDVLRYAKSKEINPNNPEGSIIATITYNFNRGTVKIERNI